MRRWYLAPAFLLFAGLCALAQQAPAPPPNAPLPRSDTPAAETQDQNTQSPADQQVDKDKDQDKDKKGNPIKRLGRHVKDQMSSGCVNALGQRCWGNDGKPQSTDDSNTQAAGPQAPAPPRSDDESSSKDRPVSIAPPPGDALEHAGVDMPDDIREVHPWDPHKSDKNVEVGDFYLKHANYRAAISRYQEALYWRDNNAMAMFRLAQALEKTGQFTDARKQYENYLKTLPHGEFAAESEKALDRLKDKPNQPITAHK